jgi:hypothetical protein
MNHVGSASAMDLEQSVGRARKKLAYAPWHMPGAIWFSEFATRYLGHRLPVLASTSTR